MKHKAPAIGPTLFGLVVFALAQVGLVAQTAKTPMPKAVAPVSNPCPRSTAGSVIHQTPALSSSNGVLNVNFSYQTTTDAQGNFLWCFMTPDGLENPTLQVNPGDLLTITVTNNNTNPQGSMSMTLNAPNCGGPTDTNLTPLSMNIHYHGTNTSPTCGSDEVIKTVINPNETFQYNVQFPANEPPGLYWYHPHIHGNAEEAVYGGAAGAIVVTGIQNLQPAVAGLDQQVLIIRDKLARTGTSEGPGGCVNGVPFKDLSVNNIPIDSFVNPDGSIGFTPAILHYEEREPQFWRVTNSTSDTILDLQLTFDGVAQNIKIVGLDGVPVNSQDGTGPGKLITGVNHWRLPPAGRVEFIANMPSKTVKLAQLITNSIDTGSAGDCDPTRPIFTLVQSDEASARREALNNGRIPPFTHFDANLQRFRGLATAPVAQNRDVYFFEDSTGFFMDVTGQPQMLFNPNAPPAIQAIQGTTELWTVENHTQENHEFHFHQVHFMVMSQNNFTTNGHNAGPPVVGQYLDMIEVPGWDGIATDPYPNVVVKIDYRGSDIGNFVFHCHILNHEDQGMMNIIQVCPSTGCPSTSEKASGSISKPDTMSHMHPEPASAAPKPTGGGTK